MSAVAPAAGVPEVASPARAITVAILAMGGEGGGVVSDWLVDLAEHGGWIAQATSVPGVAQRTGATIYYVELFPEAPARARGLDPVLALMPVPGEVDLVVASELMEAGRAVQRGFVTADRTTLVASSHRVYAVLEKIAMGDGRVDTEVLRAGARAAAREFLEADYAAIAEGCGSVIGASLFGAIAASGRLPFTREAFEAAIRRGGVGVDSSLRAFAAGHDAALAGRAADAAIRQAAQPGGAPATAATPVAEPPSAASATPVAAPAPTPQPAVSVIQLQRRPGAAPAAAAPPAPMPGPRLEALARRVRDTLPAAVHPVAFAALVRLTDYQDVAYAGHYLDLLAPFAEFEVGRDDPGATLLEAVARTLALWMSYEDTVRVADLKTRATRFERVGREVRARDDQLLSIAEFLHPRVEEIADTLPAGLGRWLLATGWARRLVGRFAHEGRIVRTTSLRGFLLLRTVAGMRRWRRGSLRYAAEHARIGRWLAAIRDAAPHDRALAVQIAEAQRLVKGYGDTHARGLRSFEAVMAALPRIAGRPDAAARLRALCDAALADEHGQALEQAIASL